MMKGIYLYMTMCVAAITFTACTNEMEESTIPADNALVLIVGDYPTFSEGPDTRVGTFDPGKTAWEEGDQILVSVSSNGSTTQYTTLTYENNTWTPSQTLTRPSGIYTINAWYAPAYEWSNGTLSLLSGKQVGMDEFLATTSSDGTITFTTNSRAYSRLRIAGASGTNLTVSLTNFTPAGDGTAPDSYALTTDDKGNAYLYGTWTTNSDLDVTYGSTSLVDKNITTASVANTSYVVDASFTTNFPNPTKCDEIGDGDTYPYILLNGTQFKDLATNGDKLKHYKMDKDIDLSTQSSNWTPFTFSGTFDGNGYAITGFSYTGGAGQFGLFNQNNGTIRNLIINCNITNNQNNANTAAIAAQNNSGGMIENCHVAGGTINGSNVAGIALINNGGRIIACSNSATLSGSYVAGISYQVLGNANFIGCYNTGELNGSSGSTGIWRLAPYGNITTSACYTTQKDICGTGTVNITNCYYLNGSTITEQSGSTVTNWQVAIDNMNSTLQSGGYNYRYEMGTDDLPVIKRYNP